MTPEELRKEGERIYPGDPFWKAKLAKALPVNSRTVRRWHEGTQNIEPDNVKRIRSLPKNAPPVPRRACRATDRQRKSRK